MWWAIALTQLATCFFTTIYYVTLMAWSFSYFFDSWKNPFPWVYDDKVWAEKS
jgi:SNF family Na+-dependent transporter